MEIKDLDLSAKEILKPWQEFIILSMGIAFLFFLDLNVDLTIYWTVMFFNIIFFLSNHYRLGIMVMGGTLYNVDMQHQNSFFLTDEQLPTYTIILPLFHEGTVIPSLVKSLCNLDYPTEKLQILLILEEEDKDTLAAIQAFNPPSQFQTIIVPNSKPQTKAKACDYALQYATGELTCIYDAEDRPDRLQLKIAANKFAISDEKVACLQCRLCYYNGHENLLTSMFEIEYQSYYNFFLPVATYFNLPIPLGGSSNHFRTSFLLSIGAWDPYNVTEDADLGMRLAATGHLTKIIYTYTKEESPITFRAWLKQRVRWIKGYFHTFFIYFRYPRKVLGTFSFGGKVFFMYILCITPFLVLFSPAIIGLTVAIYLSYFQFNPMMNLILILFTWTNMVTTILCFLYTSHMIVNVSDHKYLRYRWPFYLFYFLLLSYAAILAAYKLFKEPHKWDKTTHGVTKVEN